MRIRLFRLGIPFLWFAASLTVILLYFYYIYSDTSIKTFVSKINLKRNDDERREKISKDSTESEFNYYDLPEIVVPDTKEEETDKKQENNMQSSDKSAIVDDNPNQCKIFEETPAEINTREEYSNFTFNADWIKKRGIWNDYFENKYKQLSGDSNRPPLHVIILPHSHNDPGWLHTFEEYFQLSTQHILNSVVKKLPNLKDMTFIWTEICFLNLWWQHATNDQKEAFKKLVNEGRLEITTGGWVMTDESTVHIYAMLDQFIEGHQWVKKHLNFTPTHSWSIDPFGHGSTVPYLLGTVDFKGAIIQRIHYNWKEWLAARQYGDYIWKPQWNSVKNSQHSVLMHNMPFDMYFVDSSCGPHTNKCKPYDFRWFGNIADGELQSKADQLIEEYTRSASLYPHNVFLAIVGGDFRYDTDYEFDQQYNYKKLIDYVNANGERYKNAKMQFGTPKDYFRIIRERYDKFPSMVGDLFPYGDVFTSGRAQYWTGYFTTRPFVKITCRELEHNLRSAEILFTIGYNKVIQGNYDDDLRKSLVQNYSKLINARRNLGLFQHHDAITGTSKAAVMKNYLERMVESIKDTLKIQQQAVEILVQKEREKIHQNFIMEAFVRGNSSEIPRRSNLKISLSSSIAEIILFNSLAQERIEIATVHVSSPNIKITDAVDGSNVPFQVNYIFRNDDVKLDDEYEVIFVARLPALSLTTFHVTHVENMLPNALSTYEIRNLTHVDDDIQIGNTKFTLTIDKTTGFVKRLLSRINDFEEIPFSIGFGAYNTSVKNSGAYLFMPDLNFPERNVFVNGDKECRIIVTNGPLASYVKVNYGTLLSHTIRILKTETHLDNGIFIENYINMEERHSNYEMFMRIKSSSIVNGIEQQKPEFFTDLNGFQWQKREKVDRIGIEGNYYPITIGAFIQDNKKRLTLITNHAQGATSPERGVLEVMLDRRTPVDDDRGVGEGVKDNVPTLQQHWLTLEFHEKKVNPKHYQVPSIHAHNLIQMLNYPASIYINQVNTNEINRQVKLLKESFPCDLHLFNLRTLTSADDDDHPSRSALLIAHRINYNNCNYEDSDAFYSEICGRNMDHFDNIEIFNDVDVNYVQSTSLTALKSHGFISSFRANPIEAMELKTFNVTFG